MTDVKTKYDPDSELMTRSKIVCTIGPASESEEMLEALMLAGMDVCRLNFSHGDHAEHKERIDRIKRVRRKLDLPIAIMLDTKGPEIRIGEFKEGGVELKAGDTFTLTTRDIKGDASIVSVSYEGLPGDVEVGTRVLIDDGLVECVVEEIRDGTEIITRVQNDGELKNRKGVNIPSTILNLPSLTEKDKSDIIFGIENDVDFVAASFVRKVDDVMAIRRVLEDHGGGDIHIISKIESEEGITNLDGIIAVSDGIMVARGDLGVEIPTEIMPSIQKDIIRRSNIAGKPVITATQMLDSMIRNPRPTRAEVTDVANAILDGTDATMLSGETAAGKYPVEAVRTMNQIAVTAETSREFAESIRNRSEWLEPSTTSAISHSTCQIAEQLGAKAIITATSSGATSRSISKFRPKASIVATTLAEKTARKLNLVWGVFPILSEMYENTDEVIERSVSVALEYGVVKEGDLVVLTAGIPVGVSGKTNLIKVHTIGNIRARGIGIGKTSVTGKVCVGDTAEEIQAKFVDGDIIVAQYTDADLLPFIERASGLIVEEGGLTSHSAIIALHYGISTVVGIKDATQRFKDGETVTMDPTSGMIYEGEARVL